MVKKESAERGYLTLQEIKKHLEKVVPPFNPEKHAWGYMNKEYRHNNERAIAYLNTLLQKKNLVSSQTRKGIYELMGEYSQMLSNIGMSLYDGEEARRQAEKYFLLADRKDRAVKMYEKYLSAAQKLASDSEWSLQSEGERGVAYAQKKLEGLGLKGSGANLVSKVSSIIAVVGLGAGAFFYSTKVTGNVVGMSTQTSSLIGVGLLIVGLIAGFAWVKNRK